MSPIIADAVGAAAESFVPLCKMAVPLVLIHSGGAATKVLASNRMVKTLQLFTVI